MSVFRPLTDWLASSESVVLNRAFKNLKSNIVIFDHLYALYMH